MSNSDGSATSESYEPVALASLRSEEPFSFDLYVQINDRFILYTRKGDRLDRLRLEGLREKKIERMYLLREQEPDYRKFVSANLEIAYGAASPVPMARRADIAQGHQQWMAEFVMEDVESESKYSQARSGAERFAQFISGDAKALKAVATIRNTDQSLAAHGVSVATLSIGMAKKMGIVEPQLQRVLVLGSLLHDMAHFKNGVPFQLATNKMPPEVRSKYKRHPLEAVDRIKGLKHFDPAVVRIVSEHEELVDGTGFPNKLKRKEIHPFSMIVSTANAYDRLVTFESMSPADALNSIIIARNGKYSPESINALKYVLAAMVA